MEIDNFLVLIDVRCVERMEIEFSSHVRGVERVGVMDIVLFLKIWKLNQEVSNFNAGIT